MASSNSNQQAGMRGRPGTVAAQTAEFFDAGLRQHMLGIYNYMLGGLALSGVVAWTLTTTGAGALFFSGPGQFTPLGWGAVFAPLGLLLLASFNAARLSTPTTQALYWSIAGLQGVSLALLFQSFTGQSIAQVFFVTAASFGALSLWGYTTKRSLTGLGSFLIMGLIGVIIASIVNLFLQSSMLHFVVASIGVLVFAGLTAYDTQRLKDDYVSGVIGEAPAKAQVWGALSLYLNFVNLFQLLLSLFGQRQEQ